MPYNSTTLKLVFHNKIARLFIAGIVWVVVISFLHQALNNRSDSRKIIQIGYMPVITNLAAPLLDYASKYNGHIYFKALKFASFSEMAEAFRNDEIQAAFIIAPLSIVLHQQNKDIRIVYIGNRHESSFVVKKEIMASSINDLIGKTIAVPIRYSGHNLVLKRMIEKANIDNQIKIVEMNPPDMASALASGSLDGYFVGEPFAAKTIKSGFSKLFFYVEKVQPNFICNLMIVKQKMIENESKIVQALVSGAVRSGVWIKNNKVKAAVIASNYWGQPIELVQYALNTPEDRIVFNKYIPINEEIQEIADEMVKFGLIEDSRVEMILNDEFAKNTTLDGINEKIECILGNN
jgi:NitT/TauT family transport system substrate-binding protein